MIKLRLSKIRFYAKSLPGAVSTRVKRNIYFMPNNDNKSIIFLTTLTSIHFHQQNLQDIFTFLFSSTNVFHYTNDSH